MSKAKILITETENSWVVEAGDYSSTHFLKTNPFARDLAQQKFEECQQDADSAPNFVTRLLGGRDAMLVPLQELQQLTVLGGAAGAYLSGIIDARRSLQAAGVEVPV